MLKGLDGRNIFLDDTDHSIFMEKLNKARETGGFQLHAYCLMDNHVHLLIKEGEELGTSINQTDYRWLCAIAQQQIRSNRPSLSESF